MLELDVRLTRDGQVVVFHDSTLLRVAGQDLSIANVDYASLPNLSMAVPIDTIPGKGFFEIFNRRNLSLMTSTTR